MTYKQQEKQQEQKKTVSFNPRVIVRRGLHLNDYTKGEIKRVWYTDNELLRIKEESNFTIYLTRTGSLTRDNESHCLRALESITDAGIEQKRQLRRKVYTTVLKTQQKYNGKPYPRLLAFLYTRYAKQSVSDAYLRGIQDARDAAVAYTFVSNGRTSEDGNDSSELPPSKPTRRTSIEEKYIESYNQCSFRNICSMAA